MNEYTCYTRQGKWKLTADSDIDAMRTALYYCWRDDEDFIRLEFRKGAENYTLSIFHIDNNSHSKFAPRIGEAQKLSKKTI